MNFYSGGLPMTVNFILGGCVSSFSSWLIGCYPSTQKEELEWFKGASVDHGHCHDSSFAQLLCERVLRQEPANALLVDLSTKQP